MKKFIFVLFALVLFSTISNADDFVANVENNHVVAGEPFNLELSYNGTESNIKPDLSVLQDDFQIYSTGTSMQTSYINGVMNQQRSWNIGLIALKEGKVTIPSIKAGKLNSNSIDLTVLPAGTSLQKTKNQPQDEAKVAQKFTAEFMIDEKEPYIKQEVRGTLIIKDYIGLEFVADPQFLNADGWSIKIIEQPEISRISGGREIKVHFAMFPQNSEITEVPALQWQAAYFEAAPADNSRNFGFFDFPDFTMMRSVQKPVLIQTKPQKIKVKPVPEEYGDSWWLPAKALTLSARWNENNTELKVGDTISREIVLSATGVLDAELPDLEFAEIDEMKQYPENPQFSLSVYQNELLAQATYRIVYIPQIAGEIVLPPISLKWFNTEKNTIETATIAAQKINVAENPEFKNFIKEDKTKAEKKSPKSNLSDKLKPTKPATNSSKDLLQNNAYLWLILAFILGMLFNYILSCFKKSSEQDSKTLNKIRKNLKNNDYRRLRDNLLKFGNENFADFGVNNLNDLALLIGDEDFSLQMQVLNRILYVDAKETPDAQIILNALKNCLHQKAVKKESAQPLPKLYD